MHGEKFWKKQKTAEVTSGNGIGVLESGI